MSVKLGSFVCMLRTGDAARTRKPPAIATEIAGCRSTPPSTNAQKRESPADCFLRPMYGTRPLSMRSPSLAIAAGRTVSEPRIAQRTTSIVPSAIEVKILLPVISIPAIATSTVRPEISTAWPEVKAAFSSERRGSRPADLSSRSRRM